MMIGISHDVDVAVDGMKWQHGGGEGRDVRGGVRRDVL